jgi:hypothetical protein
VVLQNHFITSDIQSTDAVQADLSISLPFEEPVEWLVHFHEVDVSDPTLQ